MRKQIIGARQTEPIPWEEGWLDLEALARVEVTSEAPEYPVENALLPGRRDGWRASAPGPQTLRLLFDEPRALMRVQLEFRETVESRTQELFLGWATGPGEEPREIVRQQWHFDPEGATREDEDYRVELARVGVLELVIVPDISHGDARASLERLRVA
ncbi:carbohydrate-binding protein [Thiohalorhabdus methylotrophus]|uniref:Carbohydrate-binding protein n=1 Tax=Thiohalorhabdus methylotrophus TaxID=3242694 RepID=A0ABV4TPB6_9GAMM